MSKRNSILTKEAIIQIWINNIWGKELKGNKKLFSGSEGHKLELAFGLKINNLNISDFIDFELKTYSNVITLGDWKGIFIFEINKKISRTAFLEYFGKYNIKKKHYFLTQPEIPSFTEVSDRGIFWELNEEDLRLVYNPKKDKAKPLCHQSKFLTVTVLVTWDLKKLRTQFLNKYSGNMILAKKVDGVHKELLFINKLGWSFFLNNFKNNRIKLDTCIGTSCSRNRCSFRIPVNKLLEQGFTKYTLCSSSNKLIKKEFK